MIQLHTVPTPNGHKISIMLEEIGLPYEVIPYDITKGDQFKPEYLAINPNNKLPAIVDSNPIGGGNPVEVFETGAILIYLAEKSGQLLPTDPQQRYAVLKWLFFQVAGVGPMHGQAHHFIRYARMEQPYARQRYFNEVLRQCRVLEKELSQHAFIAGAQYSIADIALWPWIRALRLIDVHIKQDFPALYRWYKTIDARDAVQRGKDVINGWIYGLPPNTFMHLDEQTWSYSFGAEQYRLR
ncbi:MAG TPA: glutathione S-transferase C-terminal domain-containing protein [Dongiaceae bacterium]|nr:glutathione S-transferase C-terminal domain-containing protein [Dongiaceae bacterium]